jgi:hypothetical protein
MVTAVKFVPVTLGPEAGLVTLQTPAGSTLSIVTWNMIVTLLPIGIVKPLPEPLTVTVSPENGDAKPTRLARIAA